MKTGTDTDDSWAEFYREIGLEPEMPAATPEEEPTLFEDPEPPAEAEATEAEGDDDESEEGGEESAEAECPAGEEELNEDGTKKRRRRRRRRSKKKGPGGPGEATTEGEADEAEEPLAEVYADDGGPSPEASRELIANWDVPSWTDIVAGLHRPSGR